MAGYSSRQSTISDGNIGFASLWNDEYNQLILAMAASTGHAHDGTAGEGGYIPLIADASKQTYAEIAGVHFDFYVLQVLKLSIYDSAILPFTDNDIDLGSTTKEFKDLYIDGIAYLDGVDIGGGTIEGTAIGSTTPSNGAFTTFDSNGIDDNATSTVIQLDSNTTAGNTRMLVYDIDNGTLERVSVGAADSGGVGYKVLRIPN